MIEADVKRADFRGNPCSQRWEYAGTASAFARCAGYGETAFADEDASPEGASAAKRPTQPKAVNGLGFWRG
jgi:hypothetical protein